jgi:hypothetical protein
LEGRSAALRDVRRGLRAGGGVPSEDVVGKVEAAWRAELGRDAARGPVWERYRRGGLDELDEVLAELT